MQDALNGHEALTYRDKSIDHRRHEHPAMVAQLLKKLGAEGAVAVEELAELPLPVEGVRERLQRAEAKIKAQAQAQMAADPSFKFSSEAAQRLRGAVCASQGL